ncbi:tyrosine-type recombinase/integrase, partial [Salmonella enterica]
IPQLLLACHQYGHEDLTQIVEICLATGARWSEAERLTRPQLSPYKLTFTKTKGKKNRTVPITKWLYEKLSTRQGRMFKPCYQEFKKMLLLTDIELTEGQKTHVLRHTFGAHFMMNGGNILVLQKILGHANIRETMKYSHFAPDHLEQAVTLNPLSLAIGDKVAAEVA